MRWGRSVGFVAAVVAVILSVLSVGGARASESSSVSIHSSSVLRLEDGRYYTGRFATVDQGVVIFSASLYPGSLTPSCSRGGSVFWQLMKESGTGYLEGNGTFSFQPAPSLLGACQDLGTLTMTLTATYGDLDYAGAVGGGTFSGFGSSTSLGTFAGSLDLELSIADPIEVRSGPAVLLPQGDMVYEGPFVGTGFGVATLRLQLHEVPRTVPCPGRTLQGTWSIADGNGSVGGTAYSVVGPDYEPLGMCEGVSIEAGPIEIVLGGDPAASTGRYVGIVPQGTFKGIATDNGVWEGDVLEVYRPAP